MRILILLLLLPLFCFSQTKNEKESRIKKSEFPENALATIEETLEGAKRIRFYTETDGDKSSYEVKLKKGRVFYSVEFDKEGMLEDIELTIKKVDIPGVVYRRIEQYLGAEFKRFKIKKIQQQYVRSDFENDEKTLFNAFQNLIIDSMNYEIVVAGKKDKAYTYFEFLFDSEGKMLLRRQIVKSGYEHVLY